MIFKHLPLYLSPMKFSLKKVFFFYLAIAPLCFDALGQSQIQDAQQQADSLFDARKYTESFKLYEHILTQERQSSPGMLLRMAFIKEGLGNTTEALYYLNLYYLQSADKKVLGKMDELAEKKGLQGFEYSDKEFVQTIFYKYFFHLVLVLLALATLLLAIMFYQKFKLQTRPTAAGVSMIFVLALLFYTLNYGKGYSKSLINSNNTYIMSGPSAGAEVISIVDKGHRVDVEGQQDVWAKVEWKGQPGYIKQSKLKQVTF